MGILRKCNFNSQTILDKQDKLGTAGEGKMNS